ncbi:DUF445 domain-containing protein [Geosporobacter ferrireducens]|uniref:DUF445 domain-containing protein n=1 Tax=Geosporobacter ferrireducens TaxID=1424294 RepID=A0A1D8GD25_9FIRM|nr:DUF445 family protein [Geosporobacter ferrireducens]AOT68817.1 hypothetical protein Gferi_04140 [Geosporobacter ferrireducens]MTI56479.1 DUF445 family protein [Geosporobacter ferrireducens]
MVWVKLLILASIGAIIGWTTNILAIKLIFRPLEPIEIPVVHFKIQGLIPKRKSEIARSIGEIVEKELISIEEIIDKFIQNENKSEIIFTIKRRVKKVAEQKLPTFIPSSIKSMILDYIDDIIDKEAEIAITELIENMIHKATSTVKIADIIEEKVNNFQMDQLEYIILAIAQKELKHIEVLGGVIGFVIGLVQGIVILAF